MNTKELVSKYLEGNYYDNGKNKKIDSILEYVVRKLNLKDALTMRNCLIDKNFKMLMKDVDMIKCIEEFFKYDLNVAETSRNSYLHRNTLLYRIEKIKNLTGFNLKSFDDALTFRMLMFLYWYTT